VRTLPSSASLPARAGTRPSSATPAATAAGAVTYVVKPGDSLTSIAAWFHLHGYGQLYEQNKAILGNDPSLIYPGQRITISSRGMTTSG